MSSITPDQRKKLGREVGSKLERFYSDLDTLAPADVDSRDWLKLVENEIGSGGTLDGYEEWVQETWEPLAVTA